jgi:hypothetical protein
MRSALGLILLAACSPVVAHTPDATSIDSTPDAPTHGMVTVKVFDINNEGAVVVGAPVVFIEADGTLAGHPLTGTDGTASADVHTGASATAVVAGTSSTFIMTATGLQPNDNIILGPSAPPSMDLGTFSVSFPTYTGAASYYVYGPCGSSSSSTPPVTLSMRSDCKLDSMDLIVIPRDSANTNLAYLTKTGVPFMTNGTTTITGAYSNLAAFTANLSNLDAMITNAEVTRYVPDQFGFSSFSSGTPVNSAVTLMAPGPTGAQALVQTTLSRSTNVQQVVRQGIAGNVQSYGLDASTTLLPWISSPTFDLANHKVTISTDTTGTTNDAPDVAFAELGYQRTVNGTSTTFTWIIFGATATDMTLPLLPVEVGDVMPKMTDTTPLIEAAMLEADTLNGYADVRTDPFGKITAADAAVHPMTMIKVREAVASAPRT